MNKKEIYDRWHLVCLGLGVGCTIGALVISMLNVIWLMLITFGFIGFGYYLICKSIDNDFHDKWKQKDE